VATAIAVKATIGIPISSRSCEKKSEGKKEWKRSGREERREAKMECEKGGKKKRNETVFRDLRVQIHVRE